MRTLILLFLEDGGSFYCEQGCVSICGDLTEDCKAVLQKFIKMSIPKPKIDVERVCNNITGEEAVTIKSEDGKKYVFTFTELEMVSDHYFVAVDGSYSEGLDEEVSEPHFNVYPFADTAFSSDGACWCTQVVTIKAN